MPRKPPFASHALSASIANWGGFLNSTSALAMETMVIALAVALFPVLVSAADDPTAKPAVVAQDAEQAIAEVAEIAVTIDPADKKEGIWLRLPESISAAKRGTKVEFRYQVINNTKDTLFIEVEPVETLPSVYRDSGNRKGTGGSFTTRQHGRRYELADSNRVLLNDQLVDEGSFHCCAVVTRKARIELPDIAQPGASLNVRIYVKGYYLKNGKPFSGEIEVPIKLSE